MADSVVDLHQGGGNLAQNILQQAPEGMLIAPAVKRLGAFIIDTLLITITLHFLTGQRLSVALGDYSTFLSGLRGALFVLINWLLFFASFWLYWKYTGKSFGRSLGQRVMRIALVHDNGTVLEDHHWGGRAAAKLVYLIPVVGLFFGFRDLVRCQSEKAEYRTSIDVKHHTVAAVDWSLPADTRMKIR